MPKDLKGIHRYTEADTAANFSGLLDKLAGSVSDAKAYFAGTSAQRLALEPAPPGALWQDTDGPQKLWSPGPDGNWRQHEGKAYAAPSAWESSSGGNIYARTAVFVLPTVLAPDETLLVTQIEGSGSGYTVAAMSSITRNPTSTEVRARHLQFIGNVTQPLYIAWRIVKGAVL